MALSASLKPGSPKKTDLLVCFAVNPTAGDNAKKKKNQKKPATRAGAAKVLGKVPAFLADVVSRAAAFDGQRGQTLDVVGRPGEEAARILVVGLGNLATATVRDLLTAGGSATKAARGLKLTAFDVLVPDELAGHAIDGTPALQALTEGLLLAGYRYDLFTKEPDPEPQTVTLWTAKATAAEKAAVERATHSAIGVTLTRDLVSTPANICTPGYLATTARSLSSGKGHGKNGSGPAIHGPAGKPLKVTVLDKAALQKGGFGGILGVNLGSDEPPYLCVMEYDCGRKDAPTVCFVGKGITFDTGGYSIKTMPGMAAMKQDMAGAGAVFGIMRAIQLRQPTVNVVGVVPTTENMISGKAYRPSDVLTMYDGTTVEIGNTDAEGRLILADALAYATEKIKPDVMFDFATLTGACMVALGGHAAGLMTDDDRLADEVQAIGWQCGDRVWRLPVWEEYAKQLKSPIADLHNIGGQGGGASTAGCFLKHFVDTAAIRYAHIDIAGTAWLENGNGYTPGGATGFGVRLGLAIVDHFAAQKSGAKGKATTKASNGKATGSKATKANKKSKAKK